MLIAQRWLPSDELTQFPPKAGYKFHSQVVPRVALTSEMGFDGESGLPKSLPLTDPRNGDWLARLKAWTATAQKVYIWEYTYHGAYTLSPLPNYFVVAENLATLHSLGVRGWFSESICCHPREEMVELKVYLWGRLAFEPTLNATALAETFVDGFYSPGAAPHVMRYLRLMDASMRARGLERPGKPRPYKTNSPEKREEQKWSGGAYSAMFDNFTILDAAASLSAALNATEAGSKHRFRVSEALMAVQFVVFYRWTELQAYAETNGQPWPLSPTIAEEFDLFAAALSRSGLKGQPITKINAALAPNGTANAGGSVSVDQFREQVQAQAQAQARAQLYATVQ